MIKKLTIEIDGKDIEMSWEAFKKIHDEYERLAVSPKFAPLPEYPPPHDIRCSPGTAFRRGGPTIRFGPGCNVTDLGSTLI